MSKPTYKLPKVPKSGKYKILFEKTSDSGDKYLEWQDIWLFKDDTYHASVDRVILLGDLIEEYKPLMPGEADEEAVIRYYKAQIDDCNEVINKWESKYAKKKKKRK